MSLIAKYERMDIFRKLRPTNHLLYKNYLSINKKSIFFRDVTCPKLSFYFVINLLINTNINGNFRNVSRVLVDFQFALVFSREGPMELLLPAASRRPVTFLMLFFAKNYLSFVNDIC